MTMVDKIRAFIIARPLLVSVVLVVGGWVGEWLTKFLESLQGAPAI